MRQLLIRNEKRKNAERCFEKIYNEKQHSLIIHYSCESFYDIKDGKTPRITSIAIRFLENAQTTSFSIHKEAELKKISISDICENYDSLEKKMLDGYFKFVKDYKNYNWIHWNMRDINYGFEAIEYRYKVLGGNPTFIDNNKKFDIARLLVDKYGLNYIGHPRLEKLIEKNGITKRDYLTGKDEALCFDNKEFVKLHQSTLRKVDIINSVFEKAIEGTLKTNSTWKDIYGMSVQGVFDFINSKWYFNLISYLITLILGGIVGAWFSKIIK